jgi:cephalosporin hydroxylase
MQLENIDKRIKARVLDGVAAAYNKVVALRQNGSEGVIDPGPVSEIKAHSKHRSDISDHLVTLFLEAAEMQPSLIVELGVRSGESTLAFSQAADLFGSHLVGVDIQDCLKSYAGPQRVFVKSDDVKFAQEFPEWSKRQNIPATIDVLFIDTSHEYDHSVAEINSWFPLLSPHCKVLFHDTNMSTVYFRKDGTMGVGWANQRGVIAAIEKYFGCSLDERHDFVRFFNGWIIKHFANCNGLTILERVSVESEA